MAALIPPTSRCYPARFLL